MEHCYLMRSSSSYVITAVFLLLLAAETPLLAVWLPNPVLTPFFDIMFWAAVSLSRVPEPRRLAEKEPLDPWGPDFIDIFISKSK